jgi:hypothetical protein
MFQLFFSLSEPSKSLWHPQTLSESFVNEIKETSECLSQQTEADNKALEEHFTK